LVEADATLVVRGSIDRREGSDESNLIVNELIPFSELAGRFTRGIVVRVNEDHQAEQRLESLYEILRGYPGDCELQLVLCLADGSRVTMKSEGVRVDLNAEMRGRVDALLGPGNVRLVAALPVSGAPARHKPSGNRVLARH
jgi:DNA polymerase-3 subunit alpha